MMPRVKTEKASSAPPENRLSRPMMPACSPSAANSLTAPRSTPGTGMAVPSRRPRLSLDDLHRSPRRLDPLHRPHAEGMGAHGDSLGELPLAEYLNPAAL